MLPRLLASLFMLAPITQAPAPAPPHPPAPPTTQYGSDEGVPAVPWEDARKHLDEYGVVVGKIIHSKKNNGGILLFFDDPRADSLRLFFRRDALAHFPASPETTYTNNWVRVRGLISEFDGKPEIVVTSPDHITILPAEPAPRRFPPTQPAPERQTVRIATYNVLNLFDAYDDPYTADETTPAKPRSELIRVAATIRKVNADVICLEEVENRGMLERFNRAFLADMNYRDVIEFDSNDQRGIDCAVLTRLPVGPVTSYRHVEFAMPGGGTTRFRRDLLRVHLEPPAAVPFDVFVVHLKSKRGEPRGKPSAMRQAEAGKVRQVLDETLQVDARANFVLCGDFNDTWDSPALKVIRGAGPHALTCFVEELPADKRISYNQDPYKSMIDFILCSPMMSTRYVKQSYEIIPGSIESSGSDHNPVAAEFRLK